MHIEGRLGVDTVRRNQVCLYLALEPPTSRSVRNKFLLFKPTHGVFFFSFFCHDNLSKLIQNLLTNNACYLLTPFSMNTLVSLQLRKVLLFLLFFLFAPSVVLTIMNWICPSCLVTFGPVNLSAYFYFFVTVDLWFTYLHCSI